MSVLTETAHLATAAERAAIGVFNEQLISCSRGCPTWG